MSLFYDFQKWTIRSLLSVVISLTIGPVILVGEAYGLEDNNDVKEKNVINDLIKTRKFTEDEAKAFISKTMQNRQVENNNQTGTDSSLLNNGIIGEGDPEISCVTVSWMNQTSSSCQILNWTDINDDMENLGKSHEQARNDFLNNVTKDK